MESRWAYNGHPQTPLAPRAMQYSARAAQANDSDEEEGQYEPSSIPPARPPPPRAGYGIAAPSRPTHLAAIVTTYDPALDTSSVKRFQVPVYRINGEGLHAGDPKDPRDPWAVAGKKSSRMALMPSLEVVEYKWDKNSTSAAPPPPATAILVTNISNLTPATELHRHFAQFGRIAEHRLELDTRNGASLGILRVRYVDEVQRREDGDPVDRATAGGRQDGHQAASEAMSRTNGTKMGGPAPVTVVLDRDGSKCAAAVKAELDRRHSRKTEPQPAPSNAFQPNQMMPPQQMMPPMNHMMHPMHHSMPPQLMPGPGPLMPGPMFHGPGPMMHRGPPPGMMMPQNGPPPGVIRHNVSMPMPGPAIQQRPPSIGPPVSSNVPSSSASPASGAAAPSASSARATTAPSGSSSKPLERASYTRKDDPNPPMLPAGPHLHNQGPNPHLRAAQPPPDWSRPPPGFAFPSGPPPGFQQQPQPPGFQGGRGRGTIQSSLQPAAPVQPRAMYNGRGQGFAAVNGSMPPRQPPMQLKQRPTLRPNAPRKDEDDMELESSGSGSESDHGKDRLFFPRMDMAPRQHALNIVPMQGTTPTGPRSAPLPSKSAAPKDLTPRQMSLRRLLSNGMPHLAIDHSRLVGASAPIAEPALRAHFRDFRPSEIFSDGVRWYLTFTTYDTARRAQLVLERKPLHGVDLHPYVEPPPTHAQVFAPATPTPQQSVARSGPLSAPATLSPGKLSYTSRSTMPLSPIRRGATYTNDRELIKDARNIIIHDLLNAFERDLRVRLMEPRVRKVVERRNERLNQSGIDPSASPVKNEAKVEPSAVVKLPSFSRKAAYKGRAGEREASRSPQKAKVKAAPRPSETPDVDSEASDSTKATARRRVLKGKARPETASRSGSEDIKPRLSRRLSFTSSEDEDTGPAPRKGLQKDNDHKALDDAWLEEIDQEATRNQEARMEVELSDEERPLATFVQPVPVFDPREDLPPPDPFDPAMLVAEDDEDLNFVRLALERMRRGESLHPDLEDAPYRQLETEHVTGSARTEGYYKIAPAAKFAYLPLRNKAQVDVSHVSATAVSRAARATTRRFVAGIGQQAKATSDADVVKFNQLRTRKKQLKFARSPIHDWGLYAMEPIAPGDMICEYVGEVVRQQVADKRERMYERQGLGSSYLFRLDDEYVVDATRKGSISRLINHSCTPNSTARIIQIGGQKKIVIYAGQHIEPGSEVLYDYKFSTTEGEERIPCLCGSSGCRKYLN